MANPNPTFLTTLQGRWLNLARLVWFAVTFMATGMLVMGLLALADSLADPPPETARLLQQLGLSLDLLVGYVVAYHTVFGLVYLALAGLVFWRKSDDKLAIFISLAMLSIGLTELSQFGNPLLNRNPLWYWPVNGLQAFGYAATLTSFYLFPDGRFVPGWTRPLTVLWGGLMLIWLFYPTAPFNPVHGDTWEQTPLASLLVTLFWYSTGVFAQIYRYRRFSSPEQRQQTKWVAWGFAMSTLGILVRYGPLASLATFQSPHVWDLYDKLVGLPLGGLFMGAAPITIGLAILRFRLWDIDPIINLTVVYLTWTVSLGLVYVASVGLFQWLILTLFAGQPGLTAQEAGVVLLLSTLLVAALFVPLRYRVQSLIDRLFYREKIDFQQAFSQFSAEVRLIIDLPALFRVVVQRLTDLLPSRHGAIFLREGDAFLLAEARHLTADQFTSLPLRDDDLARLRTGQVVSRPEDSLFPLLLPLTAPKADGSELVGVFGLGPRRSEQPYSQKDQALLLSLAEQAGTAIAVAQLVELERQVAAYRASPPGRAEAQAQALLARPHTALLDLHRLAGQVEHEPEQAGLLSHLPQALVERDAPALARLAEGFNYLCAGRSAPEMLPLGLRTLTEQLESALAPAATPNDRWQALPETLAVYRLGQAMLKVSTTTQIAALLPQWVAPPAAQPAAGSDLALASTNPGRLALAASTPAGFPGDLARALAELQTVARSLEAAERVEAAEDKLFYLAQALDDLGHCQRRLSPSLFLPDRLLFQAVIETWTTCVTAALQAGQGRAQLELNQVARQVVAAEQVTLAVEVTNLGRSPASEIKIELLPGQGYQVLDGQATVDFLPVHHSTRLHFLVRPSDRDLLQFKFQLRYDDREGTGKVQTVTGALRLLAVPGQFETIPNPYAPGLPLRQRSPVFFGRDDLFSFIQEALEGTTTGRVLALIGQRRVGKTSLAQQLPARLGSGYVTVYLDGQSLAIDPGMASFFHDVALEIAQALAMPPPPLEAFQTRPGATFARDFLPRALKTLGNRRLLLLFDEFEELEMRVTSGYLEASIFSYLRHLMQHVDRLAFIFVGTHTLETLNPAYWSAFFNVALYRRVSFLEENAARALITAPVAPQLVYDDLALDKMLRATGGYPYFLQLLCHILVSEANRAERNYVVLSHINQALDQVLELGQAHFFFLWDQLTSDEKDVLDAAASLSSEGTAVTLETLVAQLQASSSAALTEAEIRETLKALVQREFLQPTGGSVAVYQFVFDLLRLWIHRQW